MICKQRVFLLGAGFNADAGSEVGYKSEGQSGYPLVGDLAQICFNLPTLCDGQSIETLFQESIEKNQLDPLRRFVEFIFENDYYILGDLIYRIETSCYSKFFDIFGDSHFITFNYDSLVEIFLLRSGKWFPHDGYGLPVQVNLLNNNHLLQKQSSSLVLHLHGTFCVYPVTFQFNRRSRSKTLWYERLEEPQFIFDPHSIANLFQPFSGVPPQWGYEYPEERIIAPIPDKTKGLKGQFIKNIYKRSTDILRLSPTTLIAIGYSFNQYDKVSYAPLLSALHVSHHY